MDMIEDILQKYHLYSFKKILLNSYNVPNTMLGIKGIALPSQRLQSTKELGNSTNNNKCDRSFEGNKNRARAHKPDLGSGGGGG